MTGAHYRYLLLEQGAGGFLVNVGINLAIAWALFRSLASVPLWGATSIAGDTVATCFLLPFMTCVIVTRMAVREIRRGRFAAPSWRRTSSPTLARLPANTERRALLLGGITVATLAPLTICLLVVIGIDQLSFQNFLVFKSLFAGILGGALTPVIALAALGDVSSETR
jgi:hypothetical protein